MYNIACNIVHCIASNITYKYRMQYIAYMDMAHDIILTQLLEESGWEMIEYTK